LRQKVEIGCDNSSPKVGEARWGMKDDCEFNIPAQKCFRQNLRCNMSKPEALVWNRLRNGQVNGLKFRRQYGVGKYILDFYCTKIRFAIEIDGNSHYLGDKIDQDSERAKYLSSRNIRVLRFTNLEVMENLDGVICNIYNYTTPSPS